ncbi:P2Y purinoceptor 14-like, partial [Periophthalmus magnuspinnatus]|uniref:P2Y purinoceptor 14-like n=1 Tax=Periophthalmus magnuspinnatus TaxID=409849 RepID=UPI002436B6C5
MTSHGNTSDLNQTLRSCTELQTSASLVFMVLHSFLFVMGLGLNIFSLRVHFCSGFQQSSTVSVYLKNLAVADFLLSLSLPIRIAHYALSHAHSHAPLVHWFYCSVGATFFYLNMYASILFMGHIAANRYLKILRPLASHRLQTVRGSWLVSGLTWVLLWVFAAVYMSVSLLGSRSQAPRHSISCDATHSPQVALLYRSLHVLLATLFFCVLVALLFFYSSISRRLSAARGLQPQCSSSRKLQRAQKNMLLLWVVFSVCFVPYHVVRLPFALQGRRCSPVLYFLKELSVLLSVLNVCLDPLIYLLFSQNYRSQLGLDRFLTTTTTTAIT